MIEERRQETEDRRQEKENGSGSHPLQIGATEYVIQSGIQTLAPYQSLL